VLVMLASWPRAEMDANAVIRAAKASPAVVLPIILMLFP